jgi:uncharacterized protein YceH (UPF0502 family)
LNEWPNWPQSLRGVLPLTVVEARVLAVLVEKRHTVPDSYPLSVNSLWAGCNQKSCRDPVLELSEAQVHEALEGLREKSLVVESSGGRVLRWAEQAKRGLSIPSESVALVATLMLRGPQTPAELRANSERLYRFSDLSALEAYLAELAEQGLVRRMPRQPGTREERWAHTLSGVAAAPAPRAEQGGALAPCARDGECGMRLQNLEVEVAALREQVAALAATLAARP